MNTALLIGLTLIVAVLPDLRLIAQAVDSSSITMNAIGFVDEDRDGINDRFQDANGDGVNDVDDKPYPHRFTFVDSDKDGENDRWLDRDGDGVNDVMHRLPDKERSVVDKCLIDLDRNGVNDVTGAKYQADDFMGHEFGFIDERTGKIQGPVLDRNGDGLDDRMQSQRWQNRRRARDFFVDEDGDGICDGRNDALRRQHGEHRHGGSGHR